jgi:hypothetical protein
MTGKVAKKRLNSEYLTQITIETKKIGRNIHEFALSVFRKL